MSEPSALPEDPVLTGTARVDRRTKALVSRLGATDIAIIDHEDLDRVAAETLVAARPLAVINAAASLSGRYPNVGPLALTEAGIPLIDAAGPDVMDISEGATISIEGGRVLVDGDEVAVGVRETTENLLAGLELAKSSMGAELERFAGTRSRGARRPRRRPRSATGSALAGTRSAAGSGGPPCNRCPGRRSARAGP